MGALLVVTLRRRLLERRALGRRVNAVALCRAYGPGALLGVVVAISESVFSRPIAVSGAFDRLAAFLGARAFPESQYYGQLMQPAVTWQVWTVLGLLAGSALAAFRARGARWRWLPDRQWGARFGAGRAPRLLIAFGGAVLVQLGAGIAGGCTSGLAISGGALLSPGAFLFMAGMFAGGIPTAWLWYRKASR
jgi:hypothetical protein